MLFPCSCFRFIPLCMFWVLASSSSSAQSTSPAPEPFKNKKWILEDSNGVPVVEISEVTVFGRYSDYFKGHIAQLSFDVKAIGDLQKWLGDDSYTEMAVNIKVMQRRSTRLEEITNEVQLKVSSTTARCNGGFNGGEYTSANFDSIEFGPLLGWTPLKERIAEYDKEQKEAAALRAREAQQAAARRAREAKAAEIDKLRRATEAAEEARERARVRAVCAELYRRTADMKVKDLTVKEEQLVRSCQVLGLYKP